MGIERLVAVMKLKNKDQKVKTLPTDVWVSQMDKREKSLMLERVKLVGQLRKAGISVSLRVVL